MGATPGLNKDHSKTSLYWEWWMRLGGLRLCDSGAREQATNHLQVPPPDRGMAWRASHECCVCVGSHAVNMRWSLDWLLLIARPSLVGIKHKSLVKKPDLPIPGITLLKVTIPCPMSKHWIKDESKGLSHDALSLAKAAWTKPSYTELLMCQRSLSYYLGSLFSP